MRKHNKNCTTTIDRLQDSTHVTHQSCHRSSDSNLLKVPPELDLGNLQPSQTKQGLSAPLADLVDDGDVGEEMMVLCGGHGFPQNLAVLEVAHQNPQAVQVRML